MKNFVNNCYRVVKTIIENYINIVLFFIVVTNLFAFITFARKNLFEYHKSLTSRFEIAVFLKLNYDKPEVVDSKIRSLYNVRSCIFLSKEKVKEKLIGLEKEILITEGNPFPDAFSIAPLEITRSAVENLSVQLSQIDGVEEVGFDKDLLAIIDNLSSLVKFTDLIFKLNLAIVYILLLTVVFLRYMEIIKIPKQVWASKWMPQLVEVFLSTNKKVFKEILYDYKLFTGLISVIFGITMFVILSLLMLKDRFVLLSIPDVILVTVTSFSAVITIIVYEKWFTS